MTALAAVPQPPQRLHHHIDDAHTFRLKGSVRPALSLAQDLGPVPASQTLSSLSLRFSLTPAQAADLARFQAQLQDPASKQFHKFLTPEQYGARFGLNTADLQKIKSWLEQNGFSDIAVAHSRTSIQFSATAGQMESAFHTSLHQYSLRGEKHFANATDPLLPKALEGVVSGVLGLHNFRFKPNARIRPQFTFAAGTHGLTPDDVATIYDLKPLYNQGLDGTGVKIAIVAQSNVDLADIRAFRTAAGLPVNDPQIVLVGADPGIKAGDEDESELDLELAGGVAKNATVLLVVGDATSGSGVGSSLVHAIDNNLAPIVSLSYGGCEKDMTMAEYTAASALLAQAATQGITILAASGDSGPAGCDIATPITHGAAVGFPASSPDVTAVGGTILHADLVGDSTLYWKYAANANGGSALAYIPEAAWHDTDQTPAWIAASGGGASIYATKPSWQTGAGVPNDGARDVPDLAFSASLSHDPYLVCAVGSCVNGFGDASGRVKVAGGTSATAPLMAAITALLVQRTGEPQGNINPRLYAIASSSSSAFHDVTQGSTILGCDLQSAGCPFGQFGFQAVAGYDQTTGLGSVDGSNLINAWPDFGLSSSSGAVTVARGNIGSAAISVSPANGFNDAVTLSCTVSNSLTNVTCSIPTAPSPGGTAALTITAGTSAGVSFFSWPTFPWDNRTGVAMLLFAASALMLWQRRTGTAAGAYACVLLAVAACGATSCGNGSASGTTTPAARPVSETGTVTVTAAATTASKSLTLAVTVQ